ncbi:hypothetical protein Tco_1478874, partial [Tanacetum coccineum]
IKVDDMTITEYLEYEDYDGYQPHSTKTCVSAKHRDHVSPRNKNPDPPLDAKTNPYLQASLSPTRPKITKTLTKPTRKNEVVKEREQGLGDWFEGELEKCWKIQQGWDKSYSDPRRQAQDDALKNWEAQIDQLRRQEHEVNECKMVHTPKNDTRMDETIQIERILSLLEKPTPGSFTIPFSFDVFNINAIAELGASINIMTKYVFDELSLEHEEGYTFWASCDPNHEICNGGGISGKKVQHYWKSTNDDDRIGLEWNGLSCTNWVRARYGMVNDVTKERILQKIWNNTLEEQTQEKTSTEEQEDPKECWETKTRAIIREMVNKLPEESFSGVSEDKDDLEGIIDYLEPTLYDGSI